MPDFKLDLGLVTQGGGPDPNSGYITYEVNGEEGEIELRGPLAAIVAEKLCQLWNAK